MASLVDGRTGSSEEVVHQLWQLAQADFEQGRTIELFGWIVSRTEGRVFAAFAEASATENGRD